MPNRRLTCCLFFLVISVSAAASVGQQAPEFDPVMDSWKSYAGVEECCDCHYSGPQNPLRSGSSAGQTSRQIEARLWLEQDKHAIARQRIEPWLASEIAGQRQQAKEKHGEALDVEQWVGPSNELSRLICDRLGFNVATDAGYRQFRDHCLTCHGGYVDGGDPRAFSRSDDRQPGISCAYCHQLGSRTDWVSRHRSSEQWRLLPIDQKAKAGMRPLEAELPQADLCLDCHVGNLAQQKFVTHAMYVAGHPPLPNFELQTFCKQMPQHWQTPEEIYKALAEFDGRRAYFELNYAPLVPDGNPPVDYAIVGWRTRKVLLGGVAARRRWLELLASAATSELWGDYAFYDCMACHHELRPDSARQQFAGSGVPGRPRQLLWPVVLSRVAAKTVNLAAELDAADRIVAEAFDRQPFGDRVAYRQAAERMLEMMDDLQDRLAAKPCDGNVPRNVLLQFAETPPTQLVDYLSARQVVWGLQQVARDIGDGDALGIPPADDEPWLGIATRLPSGRARFIFPEYLAEELQRRAAYVPFDLSASLDEIRQRLGAESN